MAENTHISWADSTLNVWMGCQETGSPACEGCYARALVEGRFGLTTWGPHGERVETKNWRGQLRKISRLALAAGRPWFVFVNSLSDFWDNQAPTGLRHQAMTEFRRHPHLTILLLTKRPQNIVKMTLAMVAAELGPYADEEGVRSWWPRNVAIGFTAVTQPEMDRDSRPALAANYLLNPAFLFWSGEPLVEPVVIPSDLLALRGRFWAITGGETNQGGHKARPSAVEWFRAPRDQCAEAGSPYHHKQNGEWGPIDDFDGGAQPVYRLGKKNTGRALDGIIHDARPEVAA